MLIEAKNLSLGYEGTKIVENLNFTVDSSDYICILGENGSGKSTLIKTILGINKPLGGTIEFSDSIKKNQIGYLPQQAEINYDFPASVWEIVLSGRVNSSKHKFFYTKNDKALARNALEELKISDLIDRPFSELSGGQKQRVLLARAICATQRLLILDEPTTALDSESSTELYRTIRELNENGVTIIEITHNVQTASENANKILHIGDYCFFGTRDEYFERNSNTI